MSLDYSSYWDIDDILAEEEKVSVRFAEASFQNSGLDSNLPPNVDISSGHTMELPIWLALPLAQYSVVDIEVPRIYKEGFKNTLEADPIVVNLREKNPFFYEVGSKLCEFLNDSELIPTLQNVFLNRAKEFVRVSYHLRIDDCSNLIRKMANKEIKVFNSGRKAAMEYRGYKDKGKGECAYEETFRKLKKIKAN